MIKVGVIGVGSMGRNHLRLYSELPHFKLIGFYDASTKTKTYADTYGVEAFDGVDHLLEEVDAVSIAVPSSLHLEVGLKVAQAKKHALIEKPLGMDVSEALALKAAFEKAGTILMVGHVERFNPVIVELQKILKNEDIIAINVQRYSPWNGRIMDADVVQDLMIHDLDIVTNALNHASTTKQILANGSVVYSKNQIDYAQALLTFQNNVVVSLTASRITEDKIREVTVHVRHAFIHANLLNRTLTVTRDTNYFSSENSTLYRQENIVERVFVPQVEPLRSELISFAECIEKKTEPEVSAADAIVALYLIDKVRDAAYISLS